MKRKESSEIRRPLAFGLVVTFVFILLVLISSIVVGRVASAETPGWYFGSAVGRLVSIFILLFMVARLGWIHSAGFTALGRLRIGILVVLLLVYSIAASAYAMTGNFDFSFSDPVLTSIAVAFIMFHAFLEEIAFRGLIMHGFVRIWGTTNRGIVMSVLVSSLFFGGYHILYLAGEPPSVVLFRIVVTFLLGILFGALVLKSGSIYPAVFFHGGLNVAGYLNLTSNGIEGTASSWLLLSLSMLPLALYGLYLLRSQTQPFHNFKSSLQTKNPVR